ncbi:MAG: translation elongation factor Ts [Verrucomicrobia bacterium]|nr:translation elongation factor Ts [Verrucomicrobiota bacterium]
MTPITPDVVAKLRDMTNAGFLTCKKALEEAQGDMNLAVEILRKKGAATAQIKAARNAKDGVITQCILPGARVGLLAEVGCETDFVARNEAFRVFCDDLAHKLAENPAIDLEAARVAHVAKMGENIQVRRHQRLEVSGHGMVAAYIHTGAKVGVLVEVGAGKETTVASDDFKQLVRDITLQIAAANPIAVRREDVPAEVVAKERDIAANSDVVKNKPPQAIVKIVEGKIEKFFKDNCLVDQGFVKNPDLTVKQHLDAIAKTLGDEITIRRFVRFQVGEVASA